MKHLRETFTDQEYAQLKDAKTRVNLTWHEFIMLLKHASYTEALVTRMLHPIQVNTVKLPEEVKE